MFGHGWGSSAERALAFPASLRETHEGASAAASSDTTDLLRICRPAADVQNAAPFT